MIAVLNAFLDDVLRFVLSSSRSRTSLIAETALRHQRVHPGYVDAYGFLDGTRCVIDWQTTGARRRMAGFCIHNIENARVFLT